MMVPPLVENAVKHGLSAVKGTGRLAIDAARRDDRIEIRVSDNGPGLDGPGPAGPDAKRKAGGYGLENIHRRLAGYYGDSASFELTRAETEGLTVATLQLPLEVPPEAERER